MEATYHSHQKNLFAQLFKSWSPGRAAGGKDYDVK